MGLVVGRRFPLRDAPGYIAAQLAGAIAAAGVLAVIASGVDGFSLSKSGFAANGFGDQSPGGYSLLAALVCEVVMTAVFLLVIMGATRRGAPNGTAPIAIGLALGALVYRAVLGVPDEDLAAPVSGDPNQAVA
jgi:aquaporin Z